MNDLEKYIEQVVQEIHCTMEEKEEMRLEFTDHLQMKVEELMMNGFTEKEAIVQAIADFGQVSQVSKELNKSISPYTKVFKIVLNTSWWVYILGMLFILLVYNRLGHYNRFPMEARISIFPFKTITLYAKELIRSFPYYFHNYIIRNFFGNLLLFLPYGFLAPLKHKAINSWFKMFLLAFITSSGIEAMQFITKVGICDIDDVIINVIGILMGYGIYRIFLKVLCRIHKDYVLG